MIDTYRSSTFTDLLVFLPHTRCTWAILIITCCNAYVNCFFVRTSSVELYGLSRKCSQKKSRDYTVNRFTYFTQYVIFFLFCFYRVPRSFWMHRSVRYLKPFRIDNSLGVNSRAVVIHLPWHILCENCVQYTSVRVHYKCFQPFQLFIGSVWVAFE